MRRLFSLLGTFIKTASTSQSVSRFQSAVLKSSRSKASRKSLEVKMHYKHGSELLTVDVDEYTKSGHKHRQYKLENIDKKMLTRLQKMISNGQWGMFFSVVNKHRIKDS